jgi:hypothetical protein
LIRTPGRWRVAGVIFDSRKLKTTGRIGRNNGSNRDDWLRSLDPGISRYVDVLDAAGVETFDSCEGGEGHSYAEPAVRFYGERGEGFRALAVSLQYGLPVRAVRRIWTVDEDGHPRPLLGSRVLGYLPRSVQRSHLGRFAVPEARCFGLISLP